MFSRNLTNNINKIYIRLLNDDVFIDIDKITNYIRYLKRVDNIKCIFDYNSLKYKFLDELVECLNLNNIEYVIRCNDYKDFDYLDNIYNIITDLTLKVPGDLSKVNYRSDDIEYMNLYFKLRNLNINNVMSFYCDVYIDKDNIYKIYETLLLLSKLKIVTNLYITDYVRSVNYKDSCLRTITKCIQPSIGYRLALDNIIENKDIKINNISELNYTYDRISKNKHMCEIDNDLSFLSINEKFQMCLCNYLNGEVCSTLDPFECLDLDGRPTEKFLECIKEDYKHFCCGCNCCQTYKERRFEF